MAAAATLPLAFWPCGVRTGRLLGAAGVLAGWLAAVVSLRLAPLRPETSWHWLPTLGVAAAIVGAIGGSLSIRIAHRALLAGVAAWLLVPAFASHHFWTRLILVGCIFPGAFLNWRTDNANGRVACLALALIAATGALILLHAGTARFAQMAAALAASLLGVAAAAQRPGVVAGVAPVASVLLPGLLASGYFHSHSGLPLVTFLLVAAAPAILSASGFSSRFNISIVAVSVVLALCLALLIATATAPIDWLFIRNVL
jgi:hypothetical protein